MCLKFIALVLKKRREEGRGEKKGPFDPSHDVRFLGTLIGKVDSAKLVYPNILAS